MPAFLKWHLYSAGISGASYYEGSFSQIARSAQGNYVAVSSRGNFFLTWQPGQTFWQPHNRCAAARPSVFVMAEITHS